MDNLILLIQGYCLPSRQRYKFSSNKLRELFELLTGEYICNKDFQDAMRLAGFRATRSSDPTRHYYRLKVINIPSVPPMYRGTGNQPKYFEYGRI